jgi:cytoskeleton protein RodZ
MPEIGDQLRETRMRQRIDITEVEAATKIRAKYLRALENEEWDLLPGPTFVKTFLRTYADYLGLDARNLVEQYRSRYERAPAGDLTPFGTNLGTRRSRTPRRPTFAPWMLIAAAVVALGAIFYLVGSCSGGEDPAEREATPTATPEHQGDAGGGGGKKKEKQEKPTRVKLQIRPTGPVSVCVEDASGEPVINNLTLDAGQDSDMFRGKRFTASFGTALAVMRVDGKDYPVSASAPIGYEIRPGKRPRELPETERPTCG